MSKTQPARGMRDFLPADVRKREYVIGIIKEVYESYGFEPLETPAVENLETLMGKYGEEGNQLVFKILKRGASLNQEFGEFSEFGNPSSIVGSAFYERRLSDLALRYDLTVPLARVVANYKNDLPKFFKRYQIQPVWRADRPARGRFREFYQCDVDAIGSSAMTVEAEQIAAICKILQRLGFNDFVIRINHRKLLTELLTLVGIQESQHIDALVALDKLDKIKEDGVYNELLQRGIAEESAHNVIGLFSELEGVIAKTENNEQANIQNLSSLDKSLFESDPAKVAIADLRKILQYAELPFVKVDPSLARGLSYYTGAIFEINVDGIGSLGGGGRYDGLIGMFQKEAVPACGFSLGLERILVVMEERGMFPPEIAESNSADVMVTIWPNESAAESVADSLALAGELRSQGLRVLLYPEADKMAKQFKYAKQIRVPYVVKQSDDEKANGNVVLENMQTGDQEIIKPEEVVAKIKPVCG